MIFVQKVVLTKFSEKRRNYISYGSCVKSKNQWMENVSRTFLNFPARLAAIAILKSIFDSRAKNVLTKFSERRRNYVSYGSCVEKNYN